MKKQVRKTAVTPKKSAKASKTKTGSKDFSKLSKENLKLKKAIDKAASELAQKNRALEIEAALEKVRVKSMQMQGVANLNDVVKELYDQLTLLGFKSGVAAINIMDATTGDMDVWMNGLKDGYDLPERYHVPYFEHPSHNQHFDYWKNGERYAVIEITGSEKLTYHNYFFSHTDFVRVPEHTQSLMISQKSLISSMAYMKYGALGWAPLVLNNEQAAILQRFAGVFEQCYTRFLDLQKAEAQTREAQIQLALERVRARTMAMQHSDELADASFILDSQVRALGIKTRGCAFNIYGENASTEWFSSESGTMPTYQIPRENVFLTYYEARLSGNAMYIQSFEGEACSAHYNYLCTLPGAGESLKKFIESGGSFPTQQIDHVVYFKYGYLLFITLQPVPEAHDIFKRFAHVFEQTYTRFLDLQKAEAQAREAQIEAALERIRSRSLAMHRSDELKEVMTVMFQKLTELNVLLGTVAVQLVDPITKDCTFWLGNDKQDAAAVKLPYDEKIISEDNYMRDFWEARNSGVSILNKVYSAEQNYSYFQYVFAHNDKDTIPPGVREFILSAPSHLYCLIVEKNSTLVADNYDSQVYTDDKIDVLKRTAKVFDQAYVRFLDLQKAEAQAREAQIEAALEKIRSRSLAMHHSNEMKEVIAVMFKTMHGLAVLYDSIAVQLFDTKTKNSFFWVGNIRHDEPPMVRLPYDEKMMSEESYLRDSWEARITNTSIINKEYSRAQKDHYFNYVIANNNTQTMPQQVRNSILNAPSHIVCLFVEKNSALFVDSFSGRLFDEEKINTLQRAARVFEQAYTRLLDLQKAEAQAREAQIEAALEKVRSRSLAMHNSSELREVVKVVFDRLKDLNFPLEDGAVSILIFKEDSDSHTQWIADPRQAYATSFEIALTDHPLSSDIILIRA